MRRRSFLLQQSWDVDVPADGLPVEAAGEQVAGGVVLTPGGAANHPAVTLSVAPRESSQSDSRHVKQSDLPIVVGKGDDFLVHRHADPVDGRVGANGCYGRPHVLQVPHFDGAVVAARHHVVSHGEDGGRHCVGVSLEDVDGVDGRVSEVPQPEGGVPG